MSIIGFSFTKIEGKTGLPSSGKISINNTVNITDVKSTKLNLDPNRETLRISFKFQTEYSPKLGHILLEGNVLLMLDKKDADAMIEGWKKKKLPTNLTASVLNHVLQKCNIQALIMARDLNLPAPLQLPKVSVNPIKKDSKEKTKKKK